MRRTFAVACAVVVIVLVFCMLPLRGQTSSSSALINQKMDEITPLEVPDKTPLQQLFKKIADQTGVRVEMAPQGWDLLPYGEQTTLKVKIENQTLRGGLQAIAR